MTAPAKLTQPWNQEAEESVIGGILLHGKAYLAARRVVDPEDFYHPALKAIYRAMVDLAEASKPIDPVTVADQMRASDTFGRLRAFGGEGYFTDLVTKVVTVENIAYHAKIVHGKATVRRTIEAAQAIAAEGYGDYGDATDYVARAQRVLAEIARGATTGQLVTQEESIRAAKREIEEAFNAREEQRNNPGAKGGPGIRTGLRTVDDLTGGGLRNEYLIIAGRPGMGKTSVAMDVVEGAATFNDCGVLVVSLEMKHAALSRRRLASRTGINGYALRSGDITPDNWRALAAAESQLARLPIWYHDSSRSIGQIGALARAWASDPDQGGRFEHRLIVTDYVQLLERDVEQGRRPWSNAEQEVREASRELAAFRSDCRAAVIGLSQLNRDVESRDPPIPVMSDLRQSGALEQDADIVALLYRAHAYDKNTDEVYRPGNGEAYPVMRLIFGKFRDGDKGTRYVGWDGPRTHCFDLPDGWAPPEPTAPAPKRRGRGNPHARGGDE